MLIRVLSILVVFAVTGCAAPMVVDIKQEPPLMALARGKVAFHTAPAWHSRPPHCIAVLPFVPATEHQSDTIAEEVARVRRSVYAHLAPLPARDIELQAIDERLRRLSPAQQRDMTTVGRVLGCDTLLIGTVTRIQADFLGVYSKGAVGAELEIVRASDGATLWEGRHIAESHGGSLPTSPLGVVSGIISATQNLDGEHFDKLAGDLARRLIATLPEFGSIAGMDGGSAVLTSLDADDPHALMLSGARRIGNSGG